LNIAADRSAAAADSSTTVIGGQHSTGPGGAGAGRPAHPTEAPTAPVTDAMLAAEFDAENREAADSAADEAVLEELADAHPDGGADEETLNEGGDEVPGGANALAGAVTWDIDVATFNSHDRVQYYLDFFLNRGRERMAIWLNRLPRYESMIRERLQRERLPGDLVYLAIFGAVTLPIGVVAFAAGVRKVQRDGSLTRWS
jgi:hypothetical protein